MICERHTAHTHSCLDASYHDNSSLESKLRLLTRDTLPNDIGKIPATNIRPTRRAIFHNVDLIGILVGIVILLAVITIWIAIGPLLPISSNWWF
ncbi:hypothetical protein BDV29DRAFT_176214 [Aspergillus leporis]|jgi:hypothetical protein|uniref:Uncharacterized protein n=1 Tax=Aspergillus leporis TaxID=41062 RepID=A0A5N5WWX2_9EURO|nr:hypothetical protein BDV29DRAFT_176214 [Aspergillus leporis]